MPTDPSPSSAGKSLHNSKMLAPSQLLKPFVSRITCFDHQCQTWQGTAVFHASQLKRFKTDDALDDAPWCLHPPAADSANDILVGIWAESSHLLSVKSANYVVKYRHQDVSSHHVSRPASTESELASVAATAPPHETASENDFIAREVLLLSSE